MDQVVDTTAAHELVVEVQVESDRDAVGGSNRPALLAVALDQHLLRGELVSGNAERAVRELLEVAGLERRPDCPELPPELRPEQRQVRLDAQLARVDLAERNLANTELVGDLVRMGRRTCGALHDQGAKRLAELHARARPRLATELDHAPQLVDLREQLGVRVGGLGPAGEVHRLGRVGARCRQQPPEVIGEQRHERSDDPEPLHERVPERSQCGGIAVPEAPARPADVPVRDVVDEGFVRADDVDGDPALVRGRRVADERVRPLHQPAIERLELALRPVREILVARLPRVDVRVVDQELARVPEGQEAALDLVPGPVSEEQVLARRLRAVLPAHDVRAHPPERLVDGDRVAPRAVHLATRLVEQLLVGEDALVRGATDERHRHERHGVEPEPDLLAHLGNPACREPLLPVRVIGQVGNGEPLRRTGPVAADDVLGALPAERRQRNDPCVEPGVAYLRDPVHLLGAGLAPDHYLVDPGTVEFLELVEAPDRALLELGARADHVQVTAAARIERERQSEVALPRDVPVAHVAKPVVHPLRVEVGRPLHRRVGVEHRLADLVGRDEPVVDDTEDERRAAAPAGRVAVDDASRLDEQAPRLEIRRSRAARRRPSKAHRSRSPATCGPPRRAAPGPAARGCARARSPRTPRPARCARSRCPRRARRRPTGSPGGRRPPAPRRGRTGPRTRARRARRRAPSARTSRPACAPPPTTRRPRSGRSRQSDSRPPRRSPEASRAWSSRRRATRPRGPRAEGARTARGARAPGTPRRTPRAARSRFRSAGTTPSSGGPGRASRARAPPRGTARCTRCSCRRRCSSRRPSPSTCRGAGSAR